MADQGVGVIRDICFLIIVMPALFGIVIKLLCYL